MPLNQDIQGRSNTNHGEDQEDGELHKSQLTLLFELIQNLVHFLDG